MTSAESPKAGPLLKCVVILSGFLFFSFLFWLFTVELGGALKMEKQVRALCPNKAGKARRESPQQIRGYLLPPFSFLFIINIIIRPSRARTCWRRFLDNFPTLFRIFLKLFPCVCSLIGRELRPIRTQPHHGGEWCHRSGIGFNQCHFFHLHTGPG